MLRYMTLGLLRDGQARHGYALMKAYRALSGIEIGPGSFYRDLPRLVAEGLVRPVENPPDADERRVPYVTTEAGATAFDAWFTSHPPEGGTDDGEDGLAARMMFFGGAAPEATRKVIAQWEDELWMRAKRLDRVRASALTRKSSDGSAFPVLPLLLQRRLKRTAADVDFLKEVQVRYEHWIARPASATESARKIPPIAMRRAAVATESSGARGSIRPAKRGITSNSHR
jgi:DNA-binding PadR family transcriptional regulator